MNRFPRRIFAGAIAVTVVGGVVWWRSHDRIGQDLLACLRAGRCEGIPVRSGPHSIPTELMTRLAKTAAIGGAARGVESIRGERTDGSNVLVIRYRIGDRTEARYAPRLTDGDHSVWLGPVVGALLFVRARQRYPQDRTMRRLNQSMAEDWSEIAPILLEGGVKTIDLGLGKAPTGLMPEVYRRRMVEDADMPITTYPG